LNIWFEKEGGSLVRIGENLKEIKEITLISFGEYIGESSL